MLDKYLLPTGWTFPVGQPRPLTIAFTFFLAFLLLPIFPLSASPFFIDNGDDPEVIEVCDILGYQNENSRSFVIPEFGQFKGSGSGLILTRYSDNTATITGEMQKVNQHWKKFEVELHFVGAYNYSEWIDLGYQAKGTQHGDESTWTFYELDANANNQLVGQGGLNGEVLNVYNADPNYGLQIGQGANDKDGDFGFSWWFNYPNSQGHGDINADITCECPENGINFIGVPQDLVLNCGDEIPVPSAVTAEDNAGEALEVDYSEFSSESGAEEVCDLENGDQHAIWFSDDDVVGNNLNQRFDFVENGTFEQFPDGTAKLTGTVENRNDDDARFSFTVWLKDASTYEEWTSIPNAASPTGFRQPKLNAGTSVDIDDQYLGWTYYEVDESKNNEFIGEGDLTGYSGTISHRPSNLRWGVQVGDRASLQSLGHGISFWFDVEGTNYHGDFNMSITDCEEQDEEFDCADDYTIVRTWTATDNCGNTSAVAQTIEINGDDEAPTLDQSQIEFSDCDIDLSLVEAAVSDNCDENPEVSVEIISVSNGSGGSSDDCQFRTQTPGGWGAPPNGNNPGAYLHANFNQVFPNGVTIGCDNSFTFTTAQSITSFLPSGGQLSPLPNGNAVNPINYGNSFAGHVLALSISVGFDNTIANFGESQGNLSDAIVSGGPLSGMTVGEVLAEANAVIGGCDSDFSLSDLHETVTSINENYVDGDQDNGYISCEEAGDECVFVYEIQVIAIDDCGNELNEVFTFEVEDNTAPQLSETPADLTIECGEEIPSYEIIATDNCDDDIEVIFEEIVGSSASCEVLPTLSQYNLVSFGDATLFNSDIEGQALVCGNASFTNYGVASTLSGVEGSSLQVGGNLTYTNGQVFSGDVTISGTVSTNGLNVLDGNLNEGQPLSVDCSELLSEATSTSTFLSGLNANGLVEDNYGTVTLTCQGESVSVFDVEASLVNNANGIYINGCSSSEAVIINVSGGTVDFSNFQIFTNTQSENIIWNLSEAGSVNISGIGIKGTLLAPNAAISFNNGHIDGSLIGGSISGNGESHNYLFEGEVPGCENECVEVINRTWTATDDCGNSTEHTQTITIEDNAAPILVGVPENQTGLCDATFEAAEVTATDNCDENVEVSVEETTSGEGCDYTITFTYTATDDCGNTATDSYSISVEDNEAPVLSQTPADLTIECDEEIPSFEITATDNCDESVEVEFEETTEFLDCGSVINRTWIATDDCGNSVEHTQTITIEDNEAPVLVGVPENLSISCDEEVPDHEVSATDNCDPDVTITFNEEVSGGCPYTITRIWTATDNCGNSVSQSQVITVIDEEAPVFVGVPEDISGECGGAPEVADVTATDNCDESVEVVFTEEVIGEVCPLTIIRTWTATDNCGNSVSASQTIEINDETAPLIEGVPENVTVECDAVPAVPQVSVSDNCDANPTLEYSEEIIPHEPMMEGAEPCGYTIVRTWVATDICGNTSTAQQEVEVVDTVAPELVGVPENITVECGEIPEPAEVTAVDNCYEGEMEVLFTEEMIGSECGYQIVRTWTVEDNCWNYASQSQVITVEDTTAPVLLGVPQNESIDCDQEISEVQVSATDNCDEEVEISMESETEDLACGYLLTRTWTATDNCGNSSSAAQIITVVDEEAPVLIGVPEDATVTCDQVPAAANVSAEDNCSANVEVIFTEEVDEGCPYTITRTWTASDDCGNTTSQSQVISVIDEEAPVLNGVPSDSTVECDQIPAVADVSASDNCTDAVEVTFSESFDPADCGYTILRTWTAEDFCGNEVVETQTITVTDSTSPSVVSQPEDLTLECTESLPTNSPEFTDNCDEELEVTYSEQVNDLDCGHEVVQTWTAIDNCGNETSVSRTVTFIDTTAPIFVNAPEDVSYECTQVPNAEELVAEDNCDDEVEISFEESVENLDCGFVITRTWTATDDCGNETSVSQTVTAIDETAPEVLSAPENATVECDEEVPNSAPEFTDNCTEELSIETTSSIEQLDCGYLIYKVWTATDECGNTTTVEQQITVIDTTAPEVISAPADITIECDEVEPTDQPIFTDNCDEELEITSASSISELDCGYQIQKTWTATDDCGNETSVSQLITVIDETAPELVGVPENLTVECDLIPAVAEVTVNDNCDENVSVAFSESIEELECGYIITRTWSAADDCGNAVEATQTITVEDNTNPELIGVPENVTVECDAIPEVAAVSAQDNCDEDLTVNVTETIEEQECGYLLIRTWAVHDDCGNSNSATQVITVEDTTAPVITSSPEDLNVECSAVPEFGQIEVEDNCDENLTIETSESQVAVDCGYELTRTWTVTDNCGNTAVATQTILVSDTTGPEIIGIPEDVTIECGEALPETPEIEFIDNCDPNPIYWITEEIEQLECGYQVVRIFRSVDACVNETIQTWVITVTDETAPVFNEVPTDTTVQCGIDGPIPTVTATDACDDEVEMEYSEVVSDGCPYTITRTWTATDDCGNSSEATQVITVEDDEAPTFVNMEPLVNVECDEIGDFTVEAIDNCGEVEIGIQSELVFSGGCLGTIERVWIATDQCGNSTTYLQLIHIEDTTAPEILNIPEDVTIDCGEEIPTVADEVIAEDNCNDVEVILDEEVSGEFCPYTITRTWTAIDDCGNMTQAQQVITVEVDVPQQQVDILAYPNPFNNKFTVTFSIPRDARVKASIHDMTGNKVMDLYDGKASAWTLYEFNKTSDWDSGTYILYLVVDGEVHHHKLIVNNQ